MLIAGSGAFQGSRWGDYSTMDIDPVDDCTFWYTTMYIGSPGLSNWQTRLGSFKFPSCFAPGYGTVEGTVTDGAAPARRASTSASPAPSAAAEESRTPRDITRSISRPGPTASRPASTATRPSTRTDVDVTPGGRRLADFTLSTAPSETVSGTVTDASGGGWPLYARLVITAPGAPVFTVFTDPVTGQLLDRRSSRATSSSFTVTAAAPGYAEGGGLLPLDPAGGGGVARLGARGRSDDLRRAGYGRTGLSEGFDAGVVPPGWSARDAARAARGPSSPKTPAAPSTTTLAAPAPSPCQQRL